jgi:AraC-like DNA-binding protein
LCASQGILISAPKGWKAKENDLMGGQGNGEVPSGVLRTVRRAPWAAGELVWGALRCDEFTRCESIYGVHEGFFVLAGCVTSRHRVIDGKPAPRGDCRAGEIDFIRAGTAISVEARGELEYLQISIDPSWPVERTRNFNPHSPWVLGSVGASVWPLIYEVSAHLKNSETIEPLLIEGVALLLAFKLSELTQAQREHSIGPLSTSRLRQITSYIDANLDTRLALSDLSDCARLSASQFAVAFRKATGMPPHRFVVLRRIDRAKAMLRDKSLTISEIALSLGFSSHSHFAHTFKILTGITPAQFRIEN